MIPLSVLLKYKTIWGIFLGYFFYGYVWFLYISWLPSYLYDVLGFSIVETGWWAGFAYGCLAVVVVLSGLAADILIRRGNPPTRVRKRFIVAGFSLGSLILPVPFIHNPVLAVALVIVTVSGIGLATANTWAITQSVAPPQNNRYPCRYPKFRINFWRVPSPNGNRLFGENYSFIYFRICTGRGCNGCLEYFATTFLIGKVEPMKN